MDSKITEGELLFDFYQSSVAVVGEASYTEITIEKAADGILYLNVYSGSHSHSAYTASPAALEKVLDVVDKYNMAKWNEKEGFSIDGAITAIRFRDDDGTLIRVSTEHFPKKYIKNPNAPFDKILSVLSGYMSKDNLIK